MKKCPAVARTQILIGSVLAVGMVALGVGTILFPGAGSAQEPDEAPLPAPTQTANTVALSPLEQLGKDILFDSTLSNPSGYSCLTCHTPETGFASTSVSEVNLLSGIMPGRVHGRFGNRKPMTYSMTAFSPKGPSYDADLDLYIGGTFWDGRTTNEPNQATEPFLNPNEMNNTPTNGIYPPDFGGYSALVVEKLQSRPYTPLFEEVFGRNVFKKSTTQQLYTIMTQAIGAYEHSAEVNPFNSKYDASEYGTPPLDHYRLSASEERGRILFGVGPNPNNDPNFGTAQCFQCHSSASLALVQNATKGKETFTMFCYANIGVPKNHNNPFYSQTDATTNPEGYNPLGANFIDWGLGANPAIGPDGNKFFYTNPGDIVEFRGLFKAPSLRNSDKRPYTNFVRAYMHNGVFKSLEDVVHFYNKRNIAVDAKGHEVAFDLRTGPPAGHTRLIAPPEVLDNVQNVAGLTPDDANAQGISGDTPTNGQVGNLGLTESEEADIVNFLKILTDGFTGPNPVN
jgi:cytochrome c peroxidase